MGRQPTRALEPLQSVPLDIFRVDAKAAGEEIVMAQLKRMHAWAYLRGDPFRAIASLELVLGGSFLAR